MRALLPLILTASMYGQEVATQISKSVSTGENTKHTFISVDQNYVKNTKRPWFKRMIGRGKKQTTTPRPDNAYSNWYAYRSTDEHLHAILLYKNTDVETEIREVSSVLEGLSPQLPIAQPIIGKDQALVSARLLENMPLASLEQLAASQPNLKDGITYTIVDRNTTEGHSIRLASGLNWYMKAKEETVNDERRLRIAYNYRIALTKESRQNSQLPMKYDAAFLAANPNFKLKTFTPEEFDNENPIQLRYLTDGMPVDRAVAAEYGKKKDDPGVKKYVSPMFYSDYMPADVQQQTSNIVLPLIAQEPQMLLSEQHFALRNGAWELVEERYGGIAGQLRYRKENGVMKFKEFAYVGIIVD